MRNTNTGCRCRVPLDQAAVPAFLQTDQLLEWADKHGVDLALDHQNRMSVSVEDAYRLRDESNAAAEKHAADEVVRKAKQQAEVAKAQERRQATFDKAYKAAQQAPGFRPPTQVEYDAWEAVHASERGLSANVLNQLGPVALPELRPSGLGRFVGEED